MKPPLVTNFQLGTRVRSRSTNVDLGLVEDFETFFLEERGYDRCVLPDEDECLECKAAEEVVIGPY